MALELAGHKFEGPFLSTNPVKNGPGVYVILGDKEDNDFKMIEAGEATDLRERLDNNPNKECWDKLGFSRIVVSVHYIDDGDAQKRADIASKIRNQFAPPCG